jgi:hypothetical protein
MITINVYVTYLKVSINTEFRDVWALSEICHQTYNNTYVLILVSQVGLSSRR